MTVEGHGFITWLLLKRISSFMTCLKSQTLVSARMILVITKKNIGWGSLGWWSTILTRQYLAIFWWGIYWNSPHADVHSHGKHVKKLIYNYLWYMMSIRIFRYTRCSISLANWGILLDNNLVKPLTTNSYLTQRI